MNNKGIISPVVIIALAGYVIVSSVGYGLSETLKNGVYDNHECAIKCKFKGGAADDCNSKCNYTPIEPVERWHP